MNAFKLAMAAALAIGIVATTGFQVFVWITSTYDVTPVNILPAIMGLAVGLFLCVRVPQNNIGPVVLMGVLSFAVLGVYQAAQDWGVAKSNLTLAMLASMAGTLAFGGVITTFLVLLPIWFPDGAGINGWSRWTARIALGLMAVAFVGMAFAEQVCVVWAEGHENVCATTVPNPWGMPGLDAGVGEFAYSILFLLAIPGVISVILRWRRSPGVERAQLKWFSLAATLVIIDFLVTVTNQALIGTTLADWAAAILLSGMWVSIGIAVTKYRLYEIDKVISRTLGYMLIAGLLGLVYAAGAVWLPTKLIGQQHPVFVAASTLAVAALFNPLRIRVMRWMDHRFYRAKYDSELLSTRLSTTLHGDLDADQLRRAWEEVVVEALAPASVATWVREDQTGH